MKKNENTNPLKITRRAADGRTLTRSELKALAVTNPAIESAVIRAAARRQSGKGLEG